MSRKAKPARVLLFCICSFLTHTGIQAQLPLSNETFTVKEGLSENVVHSLLQDKTGFLWIGTHEGLNRYDGYGFKKYMHDKTDSTTLPNSPVIRLFEDTQGNLFVETEENLAKLDRATGRFQTLPFSLQSVLTRIYLQFEPGKRAHLINFNLDANWYATALNHGAPLPSLSHSQRQRLQQAENIASFYDINKRLWILNQDRLITLDEQGKERIIVGAVALSNKDAPLFRWLFSDSNGNMWLRTPGKLYCIDKNSQSIKAIIFQSQIKDFSFENISSLLLDKRGVLWIGSFYGLKKINLNRQQFSHIVHNETEPGLASNFILGLNLHSGNKISAQHYYLDSFYSEIDLTTMDIKQHKIERVSLEKYVKDALIRNSDRIQKNIWQPQMRKMQEFPQERRMLRYLYMDREGVIWSFYINSQVINLKDKRSIFVPGAECFWDDDRFLWIASTSGGLFRYNKTDGSVKNYRANAVNSAGISSNNLLCLTPDKKGNLWIGTRAGGLNYFDKEKETFTQYTETDGLANNTIYCMVVDDDQNLWMGTAKGLSCFDPKSGKFQNFYTSDGLLNTEFNRWSAVKDSNGVLYFGGMNGIDYFKPPEVLQYRNAPPTVQFTEFKTGNQPQPLREDLELKYEQNFIVVEYAAMDFRNPQANQYMYKLKGVNNEWINAEGNRAAVFAALPPGKYIFSVKAASQKGIWGDENSIGFTILAPWWQRTWFYILCALVIGGALYGIYRFRINQINKLYRVRTKISQDLHDEVGATLTSISFLSQVASNQASIENDTAKKTLNKIGEYSREMIGEMNDIVWAINPGNDKFEKITDRIQNFALPLLSAKNIQFDFEADAGLRQVSLNMQQRKNLYLIFKEAVNNAAKYADCNTVKVKIVRENDHIRLGITDNGKGFIETEVVAGNGLSNIRYRAKEIKADISIHSGHQEGTSIILSMPITQNA